MRRTATAAIATLLLVLSSSAHAAAGPADRRDHVRTQTAVLAEVLHHDGGTYPRKLTKKIVKHRYGYRLPKNVVIARYARLHEGRQYRVCLRHKKGGWATFASATGQLKSSGRGKACRF